MLLLLLLGKWRPASHGKQPVRSRSSFSHGWTIEMNYMTAPPPPLRSPLTYWLLTTSFLAWQLSLSAATDSGDVTYGLTTTRQRRVCVCGCACVVCMYMHTYAYIYIFKKNKTKEKPVTRELEENSNTHPIPLSVRDWRLLFTSLPLSFAEAHVSRRSAATCRPMGEERFTGGKLGFPPIYVY